MPRIEITVEKQARLDVLCAEASGASRSQTAKWIESGLCTVDGKVQNKTSFKAFQGALLVIDVPEAVESTVEKEDGSQVTATDVFLPSTFGTNPSGIPLKTARRRAVFCGYAKLFALLGMIVSCVVMVLAGVCENNRLLNWCLFVLFVLFGVEIWIGCYVTANKLNKVPPFPPKQEDDSVIK